VIKDINQLFNNGYLGSFHPRSKLMGIHWKSNCQIRL